MDLFLQPSHASHSNLWSQYNKAFADAQELFIATAFLTDWTPSRTINRNCKRFLFVIGTDFGLTRKQACADVLEWLPKRFAPDFLAVPSVPDGGFHPKVVLWKKLSGDAYAIVGSSNLTRAGMRDNVEANVLVQLTKREYITLVDWIESIARDSQIITDQWIDAYREQRRRPRPAGVPPIRTRVIRFRIPSGRDAHRHIQERRAQQRAFREIARPMKSIIRSCAVGNISKRTFWRRFWDMWSMHPSRFQGSGLQFTGKSANWKQACSAMWTILDHSSRESEVGLDRIVADQLDRLAAQRNPVRRAWFTEVLCHYFPRQYPLLNNPVKRWLSRNKWRPLRGLTEGTQYIDLARKLREAIRQSPNGPRDLAELDSLIWFS